MYSCTISCALFCLFSLYRAICIYVIISAR
nr:MAG TPA: Protein of unknown function (DUF1378) [Caudoviricetes sp.]